MAVLCNTHTMIQPQKNVHTSDYNDQMGSLNTPIGHSSYPNILEYRTNHFDTLVSNVLR